MFSATRDLEFKACTVQGNLSLFRTQVGVSKRILKTKPMRRTGLDALLGEKSLG